MYLKCLPFYGIADLPEFLFCGNVLDLLEFCYTSCITTWAVLGPWKNSCDHRSDNNNGCYDTFHIRFEWLIKVTVWVSPLVLYLSRQSCAHLKLVPLNKRVSRSARSTLENQLWGIQRLVRMEFHCNKFVLGPWRRHRCLRGRFRYHRTPVRIQSLETLIKQLFAVNCFKITTLYFLLMKKFKGHLSLDKSATGAWKQSDLTHIWAIFKWP